MSRSGVVMEIGGLTVTTITGNDQRYLDYARHDEKAGRPLASRSDGLCRVCSFVAHATESAGIAAQSKGLTVPSRCPTLIFALNH
jgi:hypothetical protein